MTRTIDPETTIALYEIVKGKGAGFGDTPANTDLIVDDWVFVGSFPSCTTDQHERYWLVVHDRAEDRSYCLEDGIGLTEGQENDYPWDEAGQPLPLTHLYRQEIVTVRYLPVRSRAVAA